MSGFTCPREGCDSAGWGTNTVDGRRYHSCNGVRTMPDGSRRSCDFEYPASDHEPARTVQERELAIEEMKRGAARVQDRLASMNANSPSSAEDVAECFAELAEAARLLAYDARLAEQWAARELETKS